MGFWQFGKESKTSHINIFKKRKYFQLKLHHYLQVNLAIKIKNISYEVKDNTACNITMHNDSKSADVQGRFRLQNYSTTNKYFYIFHIASITIYVELLFSVMPKPWLRFLAMIKFGPAPRSVVECGEGGGAK